MSASLSSLQIIKRIASKEINIFFASPIAFIFLATFLGINLFIFFWVEAFFARNISDVRPLFEWMPILLIFLVAALTMRMWSEEKRMGTLEFIMTSPVSALDFVLGKFFACLFLIALALLMTLPIPITVCLISPIDWGPVVGAYCAALCLGAAYSAIGLYISAKTDSQIVSLLVTLLIGSLFYVLGSPLLTGFVGNHGSEVLKLIGTGSRFESITRGVIDLRDLFYYISIMGVFLTLNILSIEKNRWSQENPSKTHGLWQGLALLAIANLLIGNVWLNKVNSARADLTKGNIYSISNATKQYLSQLQEPLLLRGYFSAKTHPLLAPLVPQMRDLLKEYEIAGKGKVRADFIDPATHPELEDEANNKYGIKPVPFQVADKYSASLVNSYFNILIQYGDQFEVLSFQDLIEVKQKNETDLEVKLRNPEYDLTRAIKKSLNGYQSTGELFATIKQPLKFTAYVSDDSQLPEMLKTFKAEMINAVTKFSESADNKLTIEIIDPESNSPDFKTQLLENFGFRPMATDLLSQDTFYFYMTLAEETVKGETEIVQLGLPNDYSKEEFLRNLETGLKRFSSGFTKVVTLVVPEAAKPQMPHQPAPPSGDTYQYLEQILKTELTVNKSDLISGQVPEDTDILMVVSPKHLNEKQVFAIDQFLMKGGSVVLATSPYTTQLSRGGLTAQKNTSGLEDWLAHMGISFGKGMILDTQNTAFPIPVPRRVGGFTFQEMKMIDYPYFVDIRGKGIIDESLTAGLNQLTLNWTSPLVIESAQTIQIKKLLQTSEESWVSESLSVLPNLNGEAFTQLEGEGPQLVAAALEGRFSSFYADKPSPLLITADEQVAKGTTSDQQKTEPEAGEAKNSALTSLNQVIDRSSESARLIVVASNAFLGDQVLQLMSSATRTLYRNSIQLMQNSVDWSLEDRALLEIRARGHFSSTLPNLEKPAQLFWEYLNYGIVIFCLSGLFFFTRMRQAAKVNRYAKSFAQA